ncbi:MAG: hypothetical protein WA952_15295 [Lewinella sp.]
MGEHTVLRGGRGLAVPYDRFRLQWSQEEADVRLMDFAAHLSVLTLPLDLDRLTTDLQAGWRLTGNIPVGYGLGSSGAVCAAVLDRFALPAATRLGTPELRQILAIMEGFFHGSSSGTDPLLAYVQHPLLLGGGGSAGKTSLPNGWEAGWFLLDTGITRSGSPYIRRFLDAYERNPPSIAAGWLDPADRAIAALLANRSHDLYQEVTIISEFQQDCFPDFIPATYRDRWNGKDAYRLKLCGAGGGGMLLGLAVDAAKVEEVFGERLLWLADGG